MMEVPVNRVRRVFAEFGMALALMALIVARAQAQDARPAAQSRTETEVDEEVIVRGRRLSELEFDIREYVREFVTEVADPAQTRGLARWHRSVCVGVNNLERRPAQYLLDRIAALASDVGLEYGEPGCRPQVIVIFTISARELATYMVDNFPRVFRPRGGEAGSSPSREKLAAFAQSDEAVRWWHVSKPVVTFPGASRIYSGVRDDLSHVIIIVDSAKLKGTTWQQIADYLAVISLAQINPNANLESFDSILNLFTNPAAYSGLTDWDRSYIAALYTISQERNPKLQASAVVGRMIRHERDPGDKSR